MSNKNTVWKSRLLWLVSILVLLSCATFLYLRYRTSHSKINDSRWGEVIDSFHQVKVYYNGNVANTGARNLSPDGYNLGMKYQCVEFVKRYYYEYLHHQMPDSYGNAKDFFNDKLSDASFNERRGLMQFRNPSKQMPAVNDLLIFDGHLGNRYGHVAIVCEVDSASITIIQQNPGPTAPSRVQLPLIHEADSWKIDHDRVLGWLRKS